MRPPPCSSRFRTARPADAVDPIARRPYRKLLSAIHQENGGLKFKPPFLFLLLPGSAVSGRPSTIWAPQNKKSAGPTAACRLPCYTECLKRQSPKSCRRHMTGAGSCLYACAPLRHHFTLCRVAPASRAPSFLCYPSPCFPFFAARNFIGLLPFVY